MSARSRWLRRWSRSLIIGFYFIGYRPLNAAPGEQYVKPGLVVYALTALKYLASGFGGAAYRPLWQFSSLLIAVILLATFLCLIRALARSRLTGDPRAVGLASYMVSCMAVAWVVGMGRYAWGNTIFDSRYAAASVVALLGSYFVWELHGPPIPCSSGPNALLHGRRWLPGSELSAWLSPRTDPERR